jgi:host factor-I protein
MLQDQFLKNMVQTRVPVTIYLMNGIRLLGEVESFDQYGLVLGGTTQQFVYKHAISTIVPTREIAVRPAAPAERKDTAPGAQKEAAPASHNDAPPVARKEAAAPAATDAAPVAPKDAAPAERTEETPPAPKDAAPRKTTTLRARIKRS